MGDSVTIGLSPALVVEDDPGMQARLQRLLLDVAGPQAEVDFCGSIASARERLQQMTAPAIALVDVGLPDGSGIDLIAWIHDHLPALPVVVISAWGHDDTVLAALRAGAIGYLLKEREDIELALSLKSVQRGGAPIDPSIARRILRLLSDALSGASPEADARQRSASSVSLTGRETEILQLVAQGYSNREIAGLTALSNFTIEDHTRNIYRKLAVRSRTAAVHEATAQGLLH